MDADPYPGYARLVADRPFGFDPDRGSWVAASAAAVTAVLADPRGRVRPPGEPVPSGLAGTAAGDVFGRLVRMTDGAEQVRLKQVVGQALARVDPDQVAAIAVHRARSVLAGRSPGAALEQLMFAVPVQVVAGLLDPEVGIDPETAGLVADFVRCIPPTATAAEQRAASRAAGRLRHRLRPGATGPLGALLRHGDGEAANAIGLLSQTFDATAGLIGNTLLALARVGRPAEFGSGPAAFVLEVARHDAPIQSTRRYAAENIVLEGHSVETGQSILVLLAAANRDPAVNPEPHAFRPGRPDPVLFTFGAARHRCPGEALAVAVAVAVVGELLDTGWDPSTLPAIPAHRPSANARIPILLP